MKNMLKKRYETPEAELLEVVIESLLVNDSVQANEIPSGREFDDGEY